MPAIYRLRLLLTPDPSGGHVVTSPDLPELVTEGGTAHEALVNAHDALAAALELYENQQRPLPASITSEQSGQPLTFETVIEAA